MGPGAASLQASTCPMGTSSSLTSSILSFSSKRIQKPLEKKLFSPPFLQQGTRLGLVWGSSSETLRAGGRDEGGTFFFRLE